MVCNTSWAADLVLLINSVQNVLIKPKLDYGSNAYPLFTDNVVSSAVLKILDTVQNAGLRIVTGSFHCRPATKATRIRTTLNDAILTS